MLLQEIETRIFTVRGMQVMLDSDLAEMYEVETKVLNQAVKRNLERFPNDFRFQLEEFEYQVLRIKKENLTHSLRSQIVTLKSGRGKHRKYLPFVFIEQGIAMLSALINSNTAVQVSIQIMQAFINMRKFLMQNASVFQRLDLLEMKQFHSEEKIEQIFKALEAGQPKLEKGIFFDGQIFDSYAFISSLIKNAKSEIILIDNYVDESVLTLLTKRSNKVKASIFSRNISKAFQLDVEKHNSQYPEIQILQFSQSHDRFLLIDRKDLYHLGASLKDLGKKWFAFSRMDSFAEVIIMQLQLGKT
ncbi:ORF6N domain-containing protein [Algoriphagus alkaliphilus]|uniref:ORF6N domain-containing protein n=1 Tax=Algoriphagus alkaliphilus TaxID=279824 RepID=A0A1G5ZDE6_9BACT|nr:ORF6N domain-containing protein [Algoriphagus alkaliphilus]SDA92283.1 ORF6N domain-containing protein [Algoriphagus alkaliphilus]